MRYMIIVKNDPASESMATPPEVFESMGRYNQQLLDAGILLAAEGLSSSRDGALVTFNKGKPTVKDGPFTEAKELIAGFWIIQVRSMEDAVEWAKRIPMGDSGRVEVRRVSEISDFEGVMSPDAMAREEAMRTEISSKSK
jgi:hypothetical protein